MKREKLHIQVEWCSSFIHSFIGLVNIPKLLLERILLLQPHHVTLQKRRNDRTVNVDPLSKTIIDSSSDQLSKQWRSIKPLMASNPTIDGQNQQSSNPKIMFRINTWRAAAQAMRKDAPQNLLSLRSFFASIPGELAVVLPGAPIPRRPSEFHGIGPPIILAQ